jgi:hypothetical protein
LIAALFKMRFLLFLELLTPKKGMLFFKPAHLVQSLGLLPTFFAIAEPSQYSFKAYWHTADIGQKKAAPFQKQHHRPIKNH